MRRPDAKSRKKCTSTPSRDFRKSIDGLCCAGRAGYQSRVFDPVLFVFLNRHRNRVKILYWERNGFCLWLKRFGVRAVQNISR
ncbi:IS66 family insertion sequence element accessory protein TnpB [Pseudomonas syringae pv. actinidiae]|nr:IS66 family insertion sequence element accessory protein TnpB [Pseudomonas syringae pv. actinidiae]NYS40529.1 IS66 family insertion sequence element accessory protein TnpB [Pseudomonas syringae pv. actinidiae]NYS40773.1 IS66 family insertion sequence element accessory protein TnpB [Pseudomonas syringae pv. actinidiae]NYS41134.1 IS66 family insertion sequence element accessory protein TnpB [Pseudomonas syringae pv. actinidiae]NYS41175.1 IS66 family insertion sequence element accessory protein